VCSGHDILPPGVIDEDPKLARAMRCDFTGIFPAMRAFQVSLRT